MTFAQTERAALCDLLRQVGPTAPTLCEGWHTHDLAAHLWIRENDPIGATGIVAPPLAGVTERRMAEAKRRWPFPELVERIRRGPVRFSLFALPGVDEPANTTEYFVHHEDVRRAGPAPAAPRELAEQTEDWIWRRLSLLGRAMFRHAPVGVVLERTDVAHDDSTAVRVAPGAPIVTVQGHPSEILLYAFGRRSVADVHLVAGRDAVNLLDPGAVR